MKASLAPRVNSPAAAALLAAVEAGRTEDAEAAIEAIIALDEARAATLLA